MTLTTLGSTELSVSRIGLGLAALGRPGYINLGHAEDLREEYAVEKMRAHAHDVLDAAYAGGVRYFDAARSYGRAEQFLGTWLAARSLQPQDVTVGSKWGYTYTADWQVDADAHEVKEHSLAVLNRQWGETQENLDNHLDLYQVHSATLKSGILENHGVLRRLAELRESGIAVGLTVSGPRQAEIIDRALDVIIDGRQLFQTVQVTWNLLERSAEPSIVRAHAAGWGVIVKEALANGLLTPKNDDPAFSDIMGLLHNEAARLETTIDALALAAVLARPWVGVVLSGAARVDHLLSNVKALDVTWDDAAENSTQDLAERPQTYWERRSDLSWN